MSGLNVTDEDRRFAADILEDMGNFEEGITDQEKMAQWVRNVRHAAERKTSPCLRNRMQTPIVCPE